MIDISDHLKLQIAIAELGRNVFLGEAETRRRVANGYLEQFHATGCLKAYVAYAHWSEEQMRSEAKAARFDQALRSAA